MINTVKSKSKHLNSKIIQFLLTWFRIPIKLITINLKELIAMISTTNSPNMLQQHERKVIKYLNNKV